MRKSSATMVFVIVLALAALAVSTGAGSAETLAAEPSAVQAQPGPVTGSVANGRELYYQHACYSCHGFTGEMRVPFVGSTSPILADDGNFTRFLRLRGDRPSAGPSTSMPYYSEDALSDMQAKDIFAYIRSLSSNSPEASDIPTLNAIIAAASRPYEP